MIILILGQPGSGKGTQAKRLAEHFQMGYFSAGDLSRELAQKDPRIDEIVNKKGDLIPEKEMTGYVLDYLGKKFPRLENIIFEGYPRYVNQYQDLKKWLAERQKEIDLVIFLDISDQATIKRLSARRKDRKTGKIYNLISNPPPASIAPEDLVQRKDDQPEIIKKRIVEYKENTQPMIESIEAEGKLVRVKGEGPIDAIFKELVQLVEEMKKGAKNDQKSAL